MKTGGSTLDYQVFDYVTAAYIAGFEKAREMAAERIRKSVNLDGIKNPHESLINCALQAQHDYELCLKLGNEEVE